MSIETAIQQGMVARSVAEEIAVQRASRLVSAGAEKWVQELTEEAVLYLGQLGVGEAEARADLAADMTEEKDPQAFIETFVAEARLMQRLGKVEEVARLMKEDKG